MLGPIEGLKVLIEVDAAKAQMVLREFSGSVAVAGQSVADGLSPAERGVQNLMDQFADTRRRSEELDASMRQMASGSSAAATGMASAGAAIGIAAAAATALVAVGIVAWLADAVRGSEEFKAATSELGTAYKDAKNDIGGFITKTLELDTVVRGYAGAIKLVSNILKENVTSEGSIGALLFGENQMQIFRALSAFSPKSKEYEPAKLDKGEDTAYWERVFRELEKGVATNKRLAASTREVKVELTGVAAALESWIDAQQRGQGNATLNQMLGLDKDGNFPLVESGGFDELVYGIDAVTEATARLGAIAPLAFMDFTQGVETAAGAAVTLGEYVSSTFAMFEEAMLRGAGTAIYAAISGESSAKKVLKATLNAIGSEAAVQAVMEIAKAIASYAAYDYYAGSLHMKAAAVYGSVAVVAGVASRSINVDSGGSGGGGKGRGGKDFAPGPTILPPEREPQITIIIDGNVIGQEDYVRQLALDAAREMKKAGR